MLSLSTILPLGYDESDPRAFAELYHEIGARTAQVCRPAEVSLSPGRVNQVVEGLPLRVDSLHGFFGPDLDISSPDEAFRAQSCRRLADEIGFCRDIGGELLVVHPRGDADPADNARVRGDQLARSLDGLARRGEEAGVAISVENLHSAGFGSDPRDLLGVIGQCGHGSLGLCFDVGHGYSIGLADDCLGGLGPHVTCIHAADTAAGQDDHVLPGQGDIPWAKMLGQLGPVDETPFCLEVFQPLAEVRAVATPGWRAWLNELVAISGPRSQS